MTFKNNLIVIFAILIISIGQSIDIYLPSMPSMVTAFHTDASIIQLSITIGLIGYGVSALIYGPISDYFGRRIIALIGLSIFTVGSIFCATATNMGFLLVGRALQGVGYASASGVAAPAVCDVYSGQELVRAFSYVGMSMAVMPIIAPVLGGYLQHYFNWRGPFIFLVFYAIALFALFYKWFPETNKSRRKGRLHLLDIIKNYISILRSKRYLGFIFCSVFIFAGEITYVITAPFLLQTKLGINPVQNGWLILITVSGFLGGSFSSKVFCKRFNVSQLSALGCVIAVVAALIMLVLAIVVHPSILTLVLPMMFYLYGIGLIYPNAGAGAMACFPEKTGFVAALGGMLSLGIGGMLTTVITRLHLTTQTSLAAILLILGLLSLSVLSLVRTK